MSIFVQVLVALLFAVVMDTATSFMLQSRGQWMRGTTLLHAESDQRINNKIDLTSAKVVNTIEMKSGEKCVICRCWKSSKFPNCDGAHAVHNKETGDNVGPVIVIAP